MIAISDDLNYVVPFLILIWSYILKNVTRNAFLASSKPNNAVIKERDERFSGNKRKSAGFDYLYQKIFF